MNLLVSLRTERLNRGLSLRQAADDMDIADWKTLQRAEAGVRTPHPHNALKIASFYGYRVSDVWDLEPVEPTPEVAA